VRWAAAACELHSKGRSPFVYCRVWGGCVLECRMWVQGASTHWGRRLKASLQAVGQGWRRDRVLGGEGAGQAEGP